MLERLNLLRNIGQFDSVAPGAQLPFARLTAIYAENGRGKTTISAVMRSLATGNALPIQERHRLGAIHPPHVIVQAQGGAIHIFQNDAWSASHPAIAVFDDAFVAENVCSGLEIGADHRQNLHELILGVQGVALNADLQRHVSAIEDHNRRLREKSDAIPAAPRGNLTVDQFCSLPNQANLAEVIQDVERRLAAAQSAARIQREPVFDELTLPIFDVGAINSVLARSLTELEAQAAAQVQAHLSRLGGNGEQWVAQGVQLIPAASQGVAAEICPFCTQDLAGSDIIVHYRAYFSAAYSQLKQAIADARRAITAAHGGELPATFERAIRLAAERRQFWSQFAQVPEVSIDTAALGLAWRAAREAVDVAFATKQAAPLDHLNLDDASVAAIDDYHRLRAEVTTLSERLIQTNEMLTVVKEQARAADVAALTSDLSRLKATEQRHSAAIAPLCQDYLTEKQAKTATEGLRTAARAALDNYRQNIFPQYQGAINTYLQRFGAAFRLQDMASVNSRAGSSVSYSVLINQNVVPLAADGQPSFRTALSSGDRNTLALAFFFASLEQDPQLANRIVVIDDPMTSLDEHRSLVTVQELCRLMDRVSQMIVLSHFKPFLMKIWQDAPRNLLRASMRITRIQNASDVVSWDVSADAITEHDRRYARVSAYVQAADPAIERQVAADLRPMIETFIRVAYPAEFPPESLLGPFQATCEQRLNTPRQILDEDDTVELRDLLDFANRFHHDTNLAYQTEIINDQELATFALRTLNFIRR